MPNIDITRVDLMDEKNVTLMINSTFYDMLGEYNYFIKEIYPELKEICLKHDINLDYKDVAYSVGEDEFDRQIILQDLRFVDLDRTIFICFRGQKLGWKPTYEDIDGLTLDEYPELVDFIGNTSITELAIMHALIPFSKCIDGKLTPMTPVKHSLFYFRNNTYIDQLNDNQKSFYTNASNGEDKEVKDMEIAKAKDLICVTKREFDKNEGNGPQINIRYYNGTWDGNLNVHDALLEYTDEYYRMTGEDESKDYFIKTHEQYMCDDYSGCLTDFECDGTTLKEAMIEDILNALKAEFPENFN